MLRLERGVDVACDEHLGGLCHQALRELAHLQDRAAQIAWYRVVGVAQPGQLGHMLGEIA